MTASLCLLRRGTDSFARAAILLRQTTMESSATVESLLLARDEKPAAILLKVLDDREHFQSQAAGYEREVRRRRRIEKSKQRLAEESEWPQIHPYRRNQPKIDLDENPFCQDRQIEDQKHMRKMTERLKNEIKAAGSSPRGAATWAACPSTKPFERLAFSCYSGEVHPFRLPFLVNSALVTGFQRNATRHFGHRPGVRVAVESFRLDAGCVFADWDSLAVE